jgi:hypothetical protein
MDYNSSGGLKFFGALIGIIILIVLLVNFIPNMRPMHGLGIVFEESYDASSETTSYLQALIPPEWRPFGFLQRPRFALEVDVIDAGTRNCEAGEKTYVLSQYNLSLRIQDLTTGEVLDEESFVAPLPFCGEAYSLTGAIQGTLPAHGIMESWLLATLESNPNLPILDISNRNRAGFTLAADNPKVRDLMLAVFPQEMLVSLDERPAYLLFVSHRLERVVSCSYGGGALQFISLRQDIYLNLIHLETGESLVSDTVNGPTPPRCPANMTLEDAKERDILGDMVSTSSIENWLNETLATLTMDAP